ncbi:MAG: hypothetical protein QXL38_01735 [Candidatus Bathyarchaeia archaeon]
MSSHYLKCIVNGSFETVFEALKKAFGNVFAKRLDDGGKTRGIILGEQFFFRVSSDVAILILLEKLSDREVELEIISCAGGVGLLGISYNAHGAYVHQVEDFLKNSGYSLYVEKEVPCFSGL